MTAKKFKEKIEDNTKSIFTKIIEAILSPFFDENELFSWKKGMTAVVTFIFAYACIGYLHAQNFEVLPNKYIYIIVLILWHILEKIYLKDLLSLDLNTLI
jgi:hypothetical protein